MKVSEDMESFLRTIWGDISPGEINRFKELIDKVKEMEITLDRLQVWRVKAHG